MAHLHYCPIILESPCEESKLHSHRNHEEQGCGRPIPTLELPNNIMDSECTSIDRVEFSEPSRSISLLEQLRRDVSNHKQCNLPRQIKSLFSCDSQEEKRSKKLQVAVQEDSGDTLTKKEYDEIMASKALKYDLPRSDCCPLQGFHHQTHQTEPTERKPQKSLKESIYERLMQAKRDKDKARVQSKRSKQNIKEATFRPNSNNRIGNHQSSKPNLNSAAALNSVCKIKDLIKSKLAGNELMPSDLPKSIRKKPCAEFFLNIAQEEQSPPQTRPNYLTKYENILKENINTANYNLGSTKRSTSKQQQQPPSEVQIKYESFLRSLKLRESLMHPLHEPQATKQTDHRAAHETRNPAPLTKNRSMTTLTFEERQQRTVANKTDKIVKYSLQKQKEELRGCTFKPQLTPYHGFPAEMQRWSSYAQLHRRKSNNRMR